MPTLIPSTISNIDIADSLTEQLNTPTNENCGKSIKSGLRFSLAKKQHKKKDIVVVEASVDTDFESRFSEFPQRTYFSNATNRPATRRSINPLHSRLTANLVVKYQHLTQFQAFMERYHCFPYVTEYKFPINMWINEHLEHKKQESEVTEQKKEEEEEEEKEEQSQQAQQKKQEEEEKLAEIRQSESFEHVEPEDALPSLDDEEDSTSSSSDSDEGEQSDDSSNEIYIVGQEVQAPGTESEIICSEMEVAGKISSAVSFQSPRDYNNNSKPAASNKYVYGLAPSPSSNSAPKAGKAQERSGDAGNTKRTGGEGFLERSQPRQKSLKKIKDFIGLLKYEKSVYVIQE